MISLSVTNYRGLKNVSIPLSSFVCLIGENNSGKSSLLQALSLFRSGNSLRSTEFFDEEQPIRIEVVFDQIGDADLARLVDEHRSKIEAIIDDGRLAIARCYATDGKGVLRHSALVPDEPRFDVDAISELLSGERAGSAFASKVAEVFPELESTVDSTMNQAAMLQQIQELADSWPDDQKRAVDLPLPTGIDRSITALFPEPIYVPAVKDLSDDVKTSESTHFGKILAILLNSVRSSLPDEEALFENLNVKLNRVMQEDGTEVDDRLDEVKSIERTVEKYVQESFANVALRIQIPPPALKTIFSSAQIHADDGVEGLIHTKGDGLRRAIVFAILRTYAELHSMSAVETAEDDPDTAGAPYLLLFEEPELFLHPNGQHALFDALRVFAGEHHVVVTTHSPAFFGPDSTETFVKLRKASDRAISDRPFTVARNVDLSDMTARDQFQIISYDNNNSAFFADTVVLVEGDSDLILFPHIARTLNPDWDSARIPVHFARITGKGNIRRYRAFFTRFEMRVPVIADLDLLVNGFQHIDPSIELSQARDELLTTTDALIDAQGEEPSTSGEEARSAHKSGELRGLWQQVKERRAEHIDGSCTQDDVDSAVEAFFAWQRKRERLEILRASDDPNLLELKWQLFEMLRQVDVYVLERGAIEGYYPESIVGADKPTRAQNYCSTVVSRDAVLACCGEQEIMIDGEPAVINEFEAIFGSIFRDSSD